MDTPVRKTQTASPLEAHAGYWLRYVSNHVSQSFARRIENEGVTVAEWVILRELLDTEGRAPSDLATRVGMTRGGISKLCDRLTAKGLITEAQGRDDRRFLTVRLTPAGRTLTPKLAALADLNDEEFFGHLKPAERTALVNTMRDIVERHNLKTVPTE